MSGSRVLPSPGERRKFLSDWAHDLKSLLHSQVLAVRHLKESLQPSEEATVNQVYEHMEQLAFETWMFVEAAYSCVGKPNEPGGVAVDDLLQRATASLGERVTLVTSEIVVEASDYAIVRTTHEMVLLLLRTRVAKHVTVTSSVARSRLTIEAVASNEPAQPRGARLRTRLDTTFATLRALTGVVVSVNRDGLGLKAVFRVGQQADSRAQVLVLTRDATITRDVARVCSRTGFGVKTWSTSLPILVALQEAGSRTNVAACVIDAAVSDDCTDMLHLALGREQFKDRVFVVNDDRTYNLPIVLASVSRVVEGSSLAAALRESLSAGATRHANH